MSTIVKSIKHIGVYSIRQEVELFKRAGNVVHIAAFLTIYDKNDNFVESYEIKKMNNKEYFIELEKEVISHATRLNNTTIRK